MEITTEKGCETIRYKERGKSHGVSDFERIMLYYQYVKELFSILGEDIDKEWITEEDFAYEQMKDTEHYEWIDIYADDLTDNDSLIGFLIIARGDYCHPDCDYFISQAFILKKYRNKGYMTKAVKNFVGKHAGDYCMFIVHGNDIAEKFWKKRFSEMGFEENPNLAVIEGTFDKNLCKQLGFWKQKKNIK